MAAKDCFFYSLNSDIVICRGLANNYFLCHNIGNSVLYYKISILLLTSSISTIDNSEIELTLKGKVDLYSTIEIDNVSYNVRKIGGYAFHECSSLKEINIPNSINVIGGSVFAGCKFLEKVNLPNSINIIYSDTFSRCSSLAHIDIPESVKEIGSCAFSYCSSLVHVDIPEGVKNIDFAAFANCENLISISLPSTLESCYYNEATRNSSHCDYVSYIYIKAIVPPKFAYARFSFNTPEIIVLSRRSRLISHHHGRQMRVE